MSVVLLLLCGVLYVCLICIGVGSCVWLILLFVLCGSVLSMISCVGIM